MVSEEMEKLGFFRLRFRQAYDSAYDSDFQFSLGHKVSYDSGYHSDSDSVANENQPQRPYRLIFKSILVLHLVF